MKPTADLTRLTGMTLMDDRTEFGPTATIDGEQRRPSAKAIVVALVGLVLVVVVLALALGGGSTPTHTAATAPRVSNSGSGSAADSGGGASASTALKAAPPGAPAAGGTSSSTTAGVLSQQAAPNSPGTPVDPVTKVVKTGEIDLQVDKHQVPHTVDKLIALARLENGFVADSHSTEGDAPSGSVTLRVPVQSFEATITEVRTHIPGKVLEQQTAGEDVTSKYVDLQARVHSLSTTRATYERLLAHANSIGDILAVQSRISDLQTQIEQLQGELRVLNDQTTYGTLTVTVAEKGTTPKPAVTHHQSGMSKAFHRSLNRFVHGIEAIVGIIGPLLLVALLAGLAYVGYRLVSRRIAGSRAGVGGPGVVGDDRLVGEQ